MASVCCSASLVRSLNERSSNKSSRVALPARASRPSPSAARRSLTVMAAVNPGDVVADPSVIAAAVRKEKGRNT